MGLFDFLKKNNASQRGTSSLEYNNSTSGLLPPRCVDVDDSCFEIAGNHLIRFKPIDKEKRFSDILVLPDRVTSIGEKALDISANLVEMYIPPSVTFIDDKPFNFVKFVTIFGQPGSYAEEYVRKHTGSLPTYKFISIDYPSSIELETNIHKASRTKYAPFLQAQMRFETQTATDALPLTFPITLFCAENSSNCDENDNVSSVTVTIKMQDEGKLVAERKSITYSAHNIAHCTTPFITKTDITFEQLPAYIAKSKDTKSKKFLGMTKENWKNYFNQSTLGRTPSNLPVVQFGCYPHEHVKDIKPIDWYVLDEKDGFVLLLAREGLDVCQYELDCKLMVYPNKGKPGNYWDGAYKRKFSWETSNLCRWLNSEFIQTAFSENERHFIKNTNSTSNGVFSLSKDEFNRYLSKDTASQMRPSNYALHKGAGIYTLTPGEQPSPCLGDGLWWLRDTKDEDTTYGSAYMVYASGKIGDTMTDFKNLCARPAIWVSIDYWRQQN